jgi:dTDP-4-amino-4,6-dideoxygalactose transaminase
MNERDFIVFGAPVLDERDVEAVAETIRSGWIGPGPRAEAFQREFATFVHAPGALALSSCTAALHLALLTLDLVPGDEVITTPITFPATANAVVLAGGVPVFADVGPDGCVDPAAVEAAVTDRTRAIIPVHLAGKPCDLDALSGVCGRHGLTLIQDAAHAIEGRWRGKGLGAYGDAAYSFYATKNLAIGEGGMLTSTDPPRLARATLLSQHGVTRNAWARQERGNLGGYEVVEPGLNYAITDIQAALGRSQLDRLTERLEIRSRLTDRYDDLLAGGPLELLSRPPEHAVHARHLYMVLAPDREARDRLRQHLLEAGVGTGVHFEPVHLHPWYRQRFGYEPGVLPRAERFGARTLSLPLSPGLSEGDVERVAKAVLAA